MNKKNWLRKLLSALTLIVVFTIFEGCYSNEYVRQYIPVTVPEIIAMSKKGMPAKEIITKMKTSHTVYRLSATQLSKLKDEGVPGPVIDFMQQTYLTAVKRNAELENQAYWWPGYDGYWYGGPMFGWPNWGWGEGFGGDDFFGGIEEGGDD